MARFYKKAEFTSKQTNMRSNNEDYESEDSNGGGFVTGLFVGAVVGAVAALLFAPESGETTRQQLKDLAEQQKDNLKNQWDHAKEKVVSTAREGVDSLAQKASSSVDMFADKAVDKVIQIADDAKETVDKFKINNNQFGQSNQS